MCGLAGFTNVHPERRAVLASALGRGVETRGKHASGYVSTDSLARGVRYGRKRGTWTDASRAFVLGATHGVCTIIHARYATCGDKDAAVQAHPFAVKRPHADGTLRTVLWGAHNGMLEGTHASAARHERAHDVDSRELFELLADGLVTEIGELSGYGTLAWLENGARDRVRLVRLSDDAELEIVTTECGAIVWASTWEILAAALAAAGMTAKDKYTAEVGRVLEAHADGTLTYSTHP